MDSIETVSAPRIPPSVPAKLKARITCDVSASNGDVPAGHFDDTLMVHREIDAAGNKKDDAAWFAPGIGLIRREWAEMNLARAAELELQGGEDGSSKKSMQLRDFQVAAPPRDPDLQADLSMPSELSPQPQINSVAADRSKANHCPKPSSPTLTAKLMRQHPQS